MADANKTEQATPYRRRQARNRGQVARSRELPGVLAMAGAAAALIACSHAAAQQWTQLYRSVLDDAATSDLTADGPVLFWCSVQLLRSAAPVLCAAALLAAIAGLAQGGFVVAPEALQPQAGRLSPAARLSQIVSTAGLVQMLRSLLPFSAIAWTGVATLSTHWPAIVHASALDTHLLAALLGSMALSFGWKAALILLAWSGVDYLVTWRRLESELRMSRDELREELKQTDGNPAIKQRIRRIRRQTRKRFSAKAAASATVVVTNPTHYAVALRYETTMTAPVVVAKGMNLLALEIREIAAAHNIPLMENKPLAQALYKSVEIDDAIPAILYQAVADILAVVFRAQAEVHRQEALRRSRNASGQAVTRAAGNGEPR